MVVMMAGKVLPAFGLDLASPRWAGAGKPRKALKIHANGINKAGLAMLLGVIIIGECWK